MLQFGQILIVYKIGALSDMRSITGHQSDKVFESYVRIGLSEQAQMVGDKKAVSTSFLLAAQKA